MLVAPVNSAPAVMADPQIQSRDYFVAIERAVVGTHLYPGAVARLPDTPLRADAPAPLLGEHNRQVFAELLGMTNDQITELERSGVIGSTPRAASLGKVTARSLEKRRLFIDCLEQNVSRETFLVQENETRIQGAAEGGEEPNPNPFPQWEGGPDWENNLFQSGEGEPDFSRFAGL